MPAATWSCPMTRKSPRWPDPEAVRSWQRNLRKLMREAGLTQRAAAHRFQISLKLLESWLIDPDSPNHRRPSYPEKFGAQRIVYTAIRRRITHESRNGPARYQYRQQAHLFEGVEIDWQTMSDRQIQKLTGATRNAVRGRRRKFAPETIRRHENISAALDECADQIDWETMTNLEIAAIAGVNPRSLPYQRKRRAPHTIQKRVK